MLSEILDRLYPSDLYCICCGKIIDESRMYRLCNQCMENIKWNNGRTCQRCGRRLSPNNLDDVCFNCKENEHCFRYGYSCAEYGTYERYIVMRFKYGNRLQIGETMGEILTDRMLTAIDADELADAYDLLVPVPVARSKELMRGYNQANLIAVNFAVKSKLNIYNKIKKYNIQEPIYRTRNTAPMKGLSPVERRENIKDCFAVKYECKDKIKNARCLIVDDVYTTGATVDEISELLYENGARTVDFLSFASGADVIKS